AQTMAREDKKRRKHDSSSEDEGHGRRSKSPVEPRDKRRKSKSPEKVERVEKEGGGGADFSLSIQETNKLRAQLGLAPLEEDTGPKVRDAEDGELTDKIINEEGFEFRHRKADNWGDKKRDDAIKEKIEVAKKKREVYSKVLKSRGLADDSSDDEASGWVTKQRQLDEEKKKAEERAKALDALDEELADSGAIEGQSKKKKTGKKKPASNAMTGGLTIGHSKDEFLSGQEQILVLEDKGVLDDGEEVLVNPNIVDKERTTRNVDLKKKRGAREYGDDLDEFGNPKEGMLSKYDEMDGPERTTFRLDDRGGEVDIEKEKEEREMRQRLLMAGKILVNLDDSNKFTRASEFYTQEEMISFPENDIIPGINLDDVLIDDDAEDELQSMLEKARRLKQQPTRTAGARDIKVEVKEEPMEEGEQQMQATINAKETERSRRRS
ncbi:unnamed protein product, partial [Mesorhabditis spiculigera]